MAAGLRIPYHFDAFHTREALRAHNPQERFVIANNIHGIERMLIKTAKHLEQLQGGRFPIEILSRGKDADENEKLWETLTSKIKAAGVSFTTLPSLHTQF